MTSDWVYRKNLSMPFQTWWHKLPKETVVQVRSYYYPDVPDVIGPVESFWWGYEREFGDVGQGVIAMYRVLSKPKTKRKDWRSASLKTEDGYNG